jgi:hypothetical protein
VIATPRLRIKVYELRAVPAERKENRTQEAFSTSANNKFSRQTGAVDFQIRLWASVRLAECDGPTKTKIL